jgi:hypothetical protein
VIIDVDGSGYHLTGAADGVLVDFTGRGHLVRTGARTRDGAPRRSWKAAR